MTHNHETSPSKEQITENLQRAYRERAQEEVPDRFRDLLRMLREQGHQHGRAEEPRNADG
ncbi:MAG TPA: RNA polymerase subunit sigma-70 [Rhodobacteraceae bacterium]|nr:RNA polymerase subunit sigma-70 [Paracoccaceae bacterium]